MFLTKEALTLFIFKEVEGSKGVEFNGNSQRFYVVSYKNFLVENNYEVATINKKIDSIHALNRYLVATGDMKEIVVENSKDRVKIAYGSEKQVEVYSPRVARCIDNSPMEGFLEILKSEMYYLHKFSDYESLKEAIEEYIDYYNTRRYQKGLNCMTPMEFQNYISIISS